MDPLVQHQPTEHLLAGNVPTTARGGALYLGLHCTLSVCSHNVDSVILLSDYAVENVQQIRPSMV